MLRLRSNQPIMVALAAILSTSGCIFAKQSGAGSLQPDFTLQPRASILLGQVLDGSGSDGLMIGSGELMKSSIATELLKRGFQVVNSGSADGGQLLEEAKVRNIPFVLSARITIWEDNATSWSGKRDHAGISLQLFDVASETLKGSSERTADGVRHPNECAPWLASVSIAAMFGEPVTEEGPPC